MNQQSFVAVLADGDRDENQAKLQAHGLRNVLIQEESDVAERYVARATPSALLVGTDGRIASALAADGGSISALVAESTSSYAELEVVRGP